MNTARNRILAGLLVCVVLVAAGMVGGQVHRGSIRIRAFAANVIVPQSRAFSVDRRNRVEITGVKVGVVILEQAATTTMDISLRNPSNRRIEAELLVPVPEGAVVRGFAFWDRDQVDEKPWGAMVAAYAPVPGILEEKDMCLGLENEAACYVGTAGHTRRFLDMLGCDRVKAIWDLANHVQDPQSEGVPTFPDGYVLVKDDIVHMHVKDAVVKPDGSRPNVFMGMGQCHWPEQLQALKDDGYTGYISLETHVNPDQFPPP